jgi:hypothetical protein
MSRASSWMAIRMYAVVARWLSQLAALTRGGVGPQSIHQPLLLLQRPGSFHEQPQRVEGLAREGNELAFAQQAPFSDLETKGSERIHPGYVGRVHARAASARAG